MTHSTLVAYCLIANLAVIGAILALLRLGLQRTEIPTQIQLRTATYCGVGLFGWYGLVSGLGLNGAFATTIGNVPLIAVGMVAPITIALWLFLRSDRLREAAAALPVSWLVGIQAYRVLGIAFLFVWISREMPGEAAIPGGAGDVLVGLLAIPVAWAVSRASKNASAVAYAWNYLGILDFAVAAAAGFLTSPGPLQLLAIEHPNTMVSQYPMVMFPVFAIPISSVLHGICLWRLRRWSTETSLPPNLGRQIPPRLSLS